MATIYKKPKWIIKEHAQLWNYVEPDHDPINFDPYKGDFNFICTAFIASINSPRIILDEIKIPGDECAAIAKALKNGKARLVSDGSYFPEEDAGGSSFVISAGQKEMIIT